MTAANGPAAADKARLAMLDQLQSDVRFLRACIAAYDAAAQMEPGACFDREALHYMANEAQSRATAADDAIDGLMAAAVC